MSTIDKYRKILDADPTSMVFVEFAKALLDRAQLEEAIDCCRRGLEHHPDSIAGYVLWGRSLIDLGRPDEAMDQFERAMAIEPENPYAYNLIGETLLHRRLYRSALPVLRRAVSLQPGDRRVRQWLAQAARAVGDAGDEISSPFTRADPTVADCAGAIDSAFDALGSSDFPEPPEADSTQVDVGALSPFTSKEKELGRRAIFEMDSTQVVTALSSSTYPPDSEMGEALPPFSDEVTDPGSSSPDPRTAEPSKGEHGLAPEASEGLQWPLAPGEAGASESQGSSQGWPGEAYGEAQPQASEEGRQDEAYGEARPPSPAWPGMPAPEPDDSHERPSRDHAWRVATPLGSEQERSPGEPWLEASETGAPPEGDAWPAATEETGAPPSTEDYVMSGMTGMFDALEAEAEQSEMPWDEGRAGHYQGSVEEQSSSSPAPVAVPPRLPPPLPSSKSATRSSKPAEKPLELFGLELPPLPGEDLPPPPEEEAPKQPEEDPQATEVLAAEYERELREEMIVSKEPTPKSRLRGRVFLSLATLGLIATTTVVALVWAKVTGREEAINAGLEAARNGMARDTFPGYVAALDRLSEVLRIDSSNTAARALAAAAEATLYSELDPSPERRERAEVLLGDPLLMEEQPHLVLDARFHLSSPEDRSDVTTEVIAAIEAGASSATLHYLAGLHKLATEEPDEATEHFAKALEIQPGHARTVLALAHHFFSLERWEEALTYFDNVRTNYPGHGRAEIGAARARLALGRELESALAAVDGLASEHGENLATIERLHLEMVTARLQHATGETDAAIDRLRRAMRAHRETAELPLLLADIQLYRYQLPSALEAIERAESLDPDSADVKRTKARILLAWSRYEEAASVLESIESPDRRTWLERAIVAYHSQDLRAARRALDNTRNEEGQMLADAAIYLALVDLATNEAQAARTVLTRAAQARGADKLVEWSLGRWHLEQGNERPARHHLGNAVREDPLLYRGHVDLASLERRGGAHDRAMSHLTTALEANPYFREALQMLGESHLALGEYEPAREAFGRALVHHPENAAVHQGLAIALLELRIIEEAELHARSAVEHGRAEAGSHHALGRVLLAKGEAAQAIQALVQARRRDPEDPDILVHLAEAHLARGQRADGRHAKRYLEQAIEKDSRHAHAHWRLGGVHLAEKDVRNAIQSLNQAVGMFRRASNDRLLAAALLDMSRAHMEGGGRGGLERARRTAVESIRTRDTAEGREQLALVYIEENKPVLARQQLEQALALDPDRHISQYQLGRILAEAGEKDGARAALNKALSLQPRGAHVREARRILATLGD